MMKTKYKIIEIDNAGMDRTFFVRLISSLTEAEKEKYIQGNEFLFAELCHDKDLFPPIETKICYGFLYLFKYENYYKIGFTSDVDRRLRDISFYPPFAVEHVASVELQNPREAEKYWHVYYAAHQIKGEWFLFRDREFMDMVLFMLSEGGNFDCSKVYSKNEREEMSSIVKELILLGEVA